MALTFAGPQRDRLDPGLVTHLHTGQGSAEYLDGTQTSSFASPFILDTGQRAVALGGYQGWDHILGPDHLGRARRYRRQPLRRVSLRLPSRRRELRRRPPRPSELRAKAT